MASINTFSSKPLAGLLEDTIEEYPVLNFRYDNADLISSVNAIGTQIEGSLEDDTDNVSMIISKYDQLKTDDRYSFLFNNINDVSAKLGAMIVKTFNILKYEVRPEVESLKLSLEAKMQELIEEDPLDKEEIKEASSDVENLQELENIDEATPGDAGNDQKKAVPIDAVETGSESINEEDFTEPESNSEMKMLEWDKLFNRFGGVNIIIDTFRDLTGYESSGNFSDTTLALARMEDDAEDIDLDGEMEEEIDNKIDSTGVDAEQLRMLMKLITNKYQRDAYFNNLLYQIETTHDLAGTLSRNCRALATLYPSIAKFRKLPLNISEELSDKFDKNLKVIENMFWVMANQVLCFRKHYKEALVISKNMINGDLYSNYRHEGGTAQAIKNHLFVHFKDKNIYPRGLTSVEIMQTKEADSTQLHQMRAEYHSNKVERRNRKYIKALEFVLKEHLKATPMDKLPDGMNLDNFIELKSRDVESVVNKFNMSEAPNTEPILYKFVLKLWYDGTIVQKTHEMFNDAMMQKLALKRELDAEDLKLVDVEVGAKLLSEFIMENILTV